MTNDAGISYNSNGDLEMQDEPQELTGDLNVVFKITPTEFDFKINGKGSIADLLMHMLQRSNDDDSPK